MKSAQDILDGVDWSSLDHAYGSANQLPTLLARLWSEDAAVAGRGLAMLDAAVLHQGTTYTCTASAALFVASIAESRRRGDADSTHCRLRLWTSTWRRLVVPQAQGEAVAA